MSLCFSWDSVQCFVLDLAGLTFVLISVQSLHPGDGCEFDLGKLISSRHCLKPGRPIRLHPPTQLRAQWVLRPRYPWGHLQGTLAAASADASDGGRQDVSSEGGTGWPSVLVHAAKK